MATIQDLVDTMLRGQQYLLAKRAQEVDEANSKSQRLQTLVQLATGIADPSMRKALVQTGVDWGLGDTSVVKGIIDNIAPATATVSGQYAGEGYVAGKGTPEGVNRGRQAATRAATGGGTAEEAQNLLLEDAIKTYVPKMQQTSQWNDLGNAVVTRLLAGVLPGDFARQTALAGMPREDIQQGYRYSMDLEMTPAQKAQAALGWAGVGFNFANMASQAGIATAQMETQRDIAKWDNDTRLKIANLSKGGATSANVSDLLGTINTMVNTLESKKSTLSDFEINTIGTMINGSIRALNAATGGMATTLPSKVVRDPSTGQFTEIIDRDAVLQGAASTIWRGLSIGVQQAGRQ